MKARECQNVEYKTSWHDKFLEWICGFAKAGLPIPTVTSHCGGTLVSFQRGYDVVSGGNNVDIGGSSGGSLAVVMS